MLPDPSDVKDDGNNGDYAYQLCMVNLFMCLAVSLMPLMS